MPEISRFFGIIIRMFSEEGGHHHLPHFHVKYQGDQAVFGLTPIELLSGSLPRKQQRLVEAWAELHVEELIEDWKLLESGRLPRPIAPLQ
jgi:hypothetical protein